MGRRDIAVLLVDAANEFQQLAREDAEEAAKKAGLGIEVRFSGADPIAQHGDLRALLAAPTPPAAILVMAVRDRGLDRAARDAARAGVHWVFLNRSEDDLDGLRREFPDVALATVCPDEVETGRVQGRILRTLLPSGGHVVLVEGTRRSLASRDRTAGLEESVPGTNLHLQRVEAGWTEREGYEALRNWLQVAVRANYHVHAVVCHNDLLAAGAVRALKEVGEALGQPVLAGVPVVGCDGTPSGGQAMVRAGQLAATVVLPRSARPAVDLIAARLAGGKAPPPLTLLRGTPFPPLEELRPRQG
jgi:ABC-type sugar transport system substrate-binding protein